MAEKFDPIPHAERLESGVLKEESQMIEAMIRGYCQKHHPKNGLCQDCEALLHYAKKRLACCPFQENKPTCAKCTIHCYRQEERQAIRSVMREMGPKMLFSHRYEKPIQIYLMIEMAFSSRFIEYGFTRKSSDSHAIACTLPELLFLVGSAPA